MAPMEEAAEEAPAESVAEVAELKSDDALERALDSLAESEEMAEEADDIMLLADEAALLDELASWAEATATRAVMAKREERMIVVGAVWIGFGTRIWLEWRVK